jgi:hypothetical protein
LAIGLSVHALDGQGDLVVHNPLELARDTFPSVEIPIKALALVVALALGASGCVSKQKPISDAKVGGGIVPKTRLIMARLQ